MDKDKALDMALAQLEKQFGKGSVMRLGESPRMTVEAISTGSLALDIALGVGGVPRGRITEIHGAESSGKTTMAYHIVAEAQRLGGIAAFVDAEHSVDPEYARNLGVDINKLLDFAAVYRRRSFRNHGRAGALRRGGRRGAGLSRRAGAESRD